MEHLIKKYVVRQGAVLILTLLLVQTNGGSWHQAQDYKAQKAKNIKKQQAKEEALKNQRGNQEFSYNNGNENQESQNPEASEKSLNKEASGGDLNHEHALGYYDPNHVQVKPIKDNKTEIVPQLDFIKAEEEIQREQNQLQQEEVAVAAVQQEAEELLEQVKAADQDDLKLLENKYRPKFKHLQDEYSKLEKILEELDKNIEIAEQSKEMTYERQLQLQVYATQQKELQEKMKRIKVSYEELDQKLKEEQAEILQRKK